MIRSIKDQDWPGIMHLQSLAYPADFLESEATLRAKQLMGPAFCQVLELNETIHAYCLAHPWPAGQAPSLFSSLVEPCHSDNLFLHDMAIKPQFSGRGYARQLFEQLLATARTTGMTSISLAAVQGSSPFWTHLGFSVSTDYQLPASYGDRALFMSQQL